MRTFIYFSIIFLFLLSYKSTFSIDNGNGKIYLTLNHAVKRALVSNRRIQNELDNLLNAQFSLTASKSEFHFKVQPNLSTNFSGDSGSGGGLTVSKRFAYGTSLTLNTDVRKRNGDYNSGIDIHLTQPLVKGLSSNYNLASVKQSEYSLRTAQRNLHMTRINVILETVSALYDIIRKKKILELHESSFKRLQGYAEAAKIKQKKGYASALDVYRANIQLKQSQTLLSNSTEQYHDALDNLKIILSIPLVHEIEVTAPMTYEPFDVEGINTIDTALANREELKQYLDMIANLELQAKISKHNILPRLDLDVTFSANGTNPNLLDSFNVGKSTVSVGLTSSGDLSQTVERMAFQRSRIALKNARRNLSLLRDEITRQVKNAIRNLWRLHKNIKTQEEQIHEAKGKLELSKVKFSHGMADNFDLIESESQYRQAEVEYISSIIDYIVGTYRLKSVTGTLMKDYEKMLK